MEHGTYIKMINRVSYMGIVCHKLISIHNVHCIPSVYYNYIYIYAFSRRFYPKRLTLHSNYSFFTFDQLLYDQLLYV